MRSVGLALLLLSSASAAPTTRRDDALVHTLDTCTGADVQTLPGVNPRRRRYACSGSYAAHVTGAPIPPARPTPPEWWVDGQRPLIEAKLDNECPPFLPASEGWRPGHPNQHHHRRDDPSTHEAGEGCKRDAVVLAAKYIKPLNRCGPGGRCGRGGQYATCVAFNKALVYPDYSQSGFCITAGPQGIHEGQSKHQLSYVEMTLANNPNTQDFYLMAARWANAAEPARMTCDSFCKKCDRATELCPDTATSPIPSGEHGNCDCHCREGSAAADFDRCTTVSAGVCASLYCGVNGAGTFTSTGGADEGTCACTCHAGFYGRNCELEEGTPCDINDCNGRTYDTAPAGHPTGILGMRPNCQCDCGTVRGGARRRPALFSFPVPVRAEEGRSG